MSMLGKFLARAKMMGESAGDVARSGMDKLGDMPGTRGGLLGLIAGGAGASLLGGIGDHDEEVPDDVGSAYGEESDPDEDEIEEILRRHAGMAR